ncbi:DUF6415 family natural product biosynthesis protein [Streptomyces sp. NPDC047097]|uniref:DUF6415 family natural product biosynthesis protein n=1 Tax=Streptomyces sp. NPDC047097 TaxID=3155260 RepID=UPI00340F3D98
MSHATAIGEPTMPLHPPEPEPLRTGRYRVDVETIGATIARALRTGSGRPALAELAGMVEELRGHVAILLPEAQESTRRLPTDSTETHRQRARLDGIERQLRQEPGADVFTAHVRVQLLARDCEWLLARHTARTSR